MGTLGMKISSKGMIMLRKNLNWSNFVKIQKFIEKKTK